MNRESLVGAIHGWLASSSKVTGGHTGGVAAAQGVAAGANPGVPAHAKAAAASTAGPRGSPAMMLSMTHNEREDWRCKFENKMAAN